MRIKILNIDDLRGQRQKLKEEGDYWCKKIVVYNTLYSGKVRRSKTLIESQKWLDKLVKLNTRYYHRIRKINNKIQKISEKLGDTR